MKGLLSRKREGLFSYHSLPRIRREREEKKKRKKKKKVHFTSISCWKGREGEKPIIFAPGRGV